MPTKNTTAHWRQFYQTAAQFRDLAPWQWLYDSHLFGIQHPETGEIGWCSIMGRAGEHFALAVYRGAAGLNSYYRLADANDFESANNPEAFNAMMSQDCWMVSFEDAKLVPPEQKKHLKALGLSFRGAGQWIVAQTYDPGLHPWLVEEADLPWLILCLEQAIEMARQVQADPKLLEQEDWIVRTPQTQPGGGLLWENRIFTEDDLAELPEPEPVAPSKSFLEKTRFMPEIDGALVLANFFTLAPVQEHKNKRPWYPHMLLAINPGSGMVLAQDMAAYAELPGKLEHFLLTVFNTIKGKPLQIGVHHPPLAVWLEEIGDAAGIEIVELSGDEPYFTELVESLSQFFR